jgi:hypothetical protein
MVMLDEMPSALSGAWDTALLAPIAEINQALLEALRTAALDPSRTRLPRLLLTLRADWARLDQAALERAAACPYLLLDAGLAQSSFGESPLRGVMDAPTSGYVSGAEGLALVRRTLLLGWHLARANRLAARVLLGMSGSVAQRLAVSRLQELDVLAERAAASVVPRWEHQPRVWQQLLRAACRGPALQLRAAHLRGLQLLAATCGGEAGSC